MTGFVNTGIGNWAVPDSPNWRDAAKITNQFSEEQMAHFIKYFQYNDFAGINLYIDLIPPKMYQQIEKSIGKATQTSNFPGAGKVVFIPKPTAWQPLVDAKKAAKMRYPCGCD